ncbi:MAG: hypothetical protein JJU15_09910 [Pararhodobacter sp.]|nr:hypothetical protein [Pararhodobacter sp.]
MPTLALVFLLAGLTRVGAGIGTALAEGPEPRAEQVAALADTPANAAPAHSSEAWDSTASAALLIQMTRREETLRMRELALEERETLLEAAVGRLTNQIAALEAAERDLAATMALADHAAEEDLARMVRVFESMKADEAARVFTEMDPSFAAGFLSRLNPDAAAAIMAGLEPRQAYLLSAIVAGRNALVPRN